MKMAAPRGDAKHFMTSFILFWKRPWRRQLIRGTVYMFVFNDLKCCFVGLILQQELIMAPLYLAEHAPFERAARGTSEKRFCKCPILLTAGKLGDVMVTARLTPACMRSRARALPSEASRERQCKVTGCSKAFWYFGQQQVRYKETQMSTWTYATSTERRFLTRCVFQPQCLNVPLDCQVFFLITLDRRRSQIWKWHLNIHKGPF